MSAQQRISAAASRQPQAGAENTGRPTHSCNHVVQFYEDDAFLCKTVADFVAEGLTSGDPAVLIATEAHRTAFVDGLRDKGFDVERLLNDAQIVVLDARETLARFMVGNLPDAALFMTTVGGVVAESLRLNGRSVLRAYGEMVDLLWRDDNPEAAIALEELWNELAAKHSFSLLCAYRLDSFYKEAHTGGFQHVCRTHTHVLPAESYLEVDDEASRLREIALLQQQARALATEVKYRKEVERALRDALAARSRAEELVRRSEQELRDFVDNAAEGLHWVDGTGIITWANQAELDLLGYSREEYVGHHITEFHADPETINDILTRLIRNETLREYEARLRCKDGSIKHVLINSNVLWDKDTFVHTRCFTRDITDLKQTQTLLEDAVQARDDFLSVASHELRNPVNAIHLQLIGVLRVAQQGEPSLPADWVAERVGRASEQVGRLTRLLDNLLDVSRITAGRIDLELEEADFARVIGAVVDRHKDALRSGQLTMQLAEAPGSWDKLRLDQVVTNLLSNAIKYGEGKQIELWLDVEGDMVCLSVRDHGIGIDAADQERLFRRFERSASSRHYSGFGLGLWITREIVQAMGGRITVHSQPGKGSTFYVVLPRQPFAKA